MSYKRRLVIDASIMRSAGGSSATDPVSKQCKDILEAILEAGHRPAVNNMLLTEWDKHQSQAARIWRFKMVNLRRIVHVSDDMNVPMRARILAVYTEASSKQDALSKDFHLIEIAIAADWTVMSRDDIMRDLLAGACDVEEKLTRIVWVNSDDPGIIEWLIAGAIPEDEKRLPHYKPKPKYPND